MYNLASKNLSVPEDIFFFFALPRFSNKLPSWLATQASVAMCSPKENSRHFRKLAETPIKKAPLLSSLQCENVWAEREIKLATCGNSSRTPVVVQSRW